MKKNHRHTLFASICFILLSGTILFGCGQASTQTSLKQKKFDRFLNSCFREYAAENTVTLHFKLSNPSAYGIKTPVSPTYGDLSSDALKKNCSRSKELLQKLYTFPTSSLTKKQKLTWQIFQDYLNESIMNEKYILYSSPLGTNGLQSEIPVTLSEYRLDNEKDIKDYLSLVNQVPELFTQILDFEQERRNAGIISPSFVISDTIDQIDQFLNASEENNLLIQSFEERLAEVEPLSKDQKASYIANNRLLVTNKVLPAYKSLKTSLQAYTNDSKNTSSKERLCEYKNGQDYYKFLLMSNVGTDFSPEDCITILESQLKNTVKDISSLTTKNKDLYTEYLSATPALSAPKEIMNTLKNDSLIDFPEIKNISCQLKNVPDALSGTSACAFYLVPPIDSTKDNIIYINKSRVDSNELFSTLAHEGYPGHLYQTVYFSASEPDPIRSILDFGGYVEGWATYAEMMSYYLAPLPKTEASLLQKNSSVILGLYALADMGIHYDGWSVTDTVRFFSDYGINDPNAVQSVYKLIIGSPANYLKYYIGYLKFYELKKEMADALGNQFSQKEFHRAVLDVGPAPFEIVYDEVEKNLLD